MPSKRSERHQSRQSETMAGVLANSTQLEASKILVVAPWSQTLSKADFRRLSRNSSNTPAKNMSEMIA